MENNFVKNISLQNFKCFDSKKFYEFNLYKDRNPTILSGPNGFGKTTIFDAIELSLTGKIRRIEESDYSDGRSSFSTPYFQ